MKVLIISDASSVGAKDASALAEIRHALESEAHDVDIVRVDPTLSDDFAAKAAALLSGADVVVFGNGDQTSKGFVEKMLMLSDGVQAERDALQADNDDLRAHNDSLTSDNAGLRASNDELTRDNASLQASNDTYVRINSSLQEDNDELRASNAGLTKDNDELRASNDTYARINSSLVESNEGLTRDNAALKESNDGYVRDNAALQAHNDSLTSDNAGLRASNDELTRDNASLQASNDTYARINSSLQEFNENLTRDNESLTRDNESLTRDNDALRASNSGLAHDNDALTAGNDALRADNSALLADNDELRHDSREDALTHIMNRRGYEQDWPQFMLDHPTFILISVDINDFKLFNDLFGHHIGDQLLMSLANEFRALVPKDALVARSGGDEFVLLVPGPDEAWMQEADGFFNSTHSFEFEGMTYTYMLSGGFAAYPEQTDSFATLTRMADSALYHAKMLAKDKFFKYTPEMENDFRVTLGFIARSLAATAPGAMLVFKSEGDHEILFANDLCAELFGYPSVAEFLGANQGLSRLVCPEDRDRFDRSLTEQAAHPDARRQSSATYRLMSRDGSVRTVLAVERMSENDRFGRVFHAVFFDPETIGEGLGFIGD